MSIIQPFRSRLLLPKKLPFTDPVERRFYYCYRRSGALPFDPLGLGNTQLISDLGGNSAVLAFYDVRQNVTLSGLTVPAWDDVRGAGAGFGPTLSGAGHAPAWDGVNQLVTTDGAATYLASSAVALFNNFGVGLTVVYVGNIPSAASRKFAVAVANAAVQTAGVGLTSESSGFIGARFNGGTATSTAATGSALRLSFAAKESTTAGDVEVPTLAQVRQFGSAAVSANCSLTLGDVVAGGGSLLATSARAILVLAGLYTTTQRDKIKTWAQTYHGVTLL